MWGWENIREYFKERKHVTLKWSKVHSLQSKFHQVVPWICNQKKWPIFMLFQTCIGRDPINSLANTDWLLVLILYHNSTADFPQQTFLIIGWKWTRAGSRGGGWRQNVFPRNEERQCEQAEQHSCLITLQGGKWPEAVRSYQANRDEANLGRLIKTILRIVGRINRPSVSDDLDGAPSHIFNCRSSLLSVSFTVLHFSFSYKLVFAAVILQQVTWSLLSCAVQTFTTCVNVYVMCLVS